MHRKFLLLFYNIRKRDICVKIVWSSIENGFNSDGIPSLQVIFWMNETD